MKVSVVKRAGFCFGVKRAVGIAFDMAKKNRGGVYTLGPIIHNPQVVDKLKEEGIMPIEDIERVGGNDVSAVIVRTHGVPLDIMRRIGKSGVEIIDATCPFVKKAQLYAKLLRDEGYRVVILGDSEHPEVKGLMSYAGRGAVVVGDVLKIPVLKKKVGIVVQTTQQVETLKKLLAAIVEHSKELKVYNTICNSTALRLKETKELAEKVDVMVIVGGRNSANTTQLAALCRSLVVPSFHIETAAELKEQWFSSADNVGITAGASTPDWIIKGVRKRIKNIGGSPSDGNQGRRT
jgi:4-hydroxy-3-methylbut-2-enyl diphosphate reductase